jgi:hypothetical protein
MPPSRGVSKAAASRVQRPALAWWILINGGMLACGAAAYGPAQLPVWLAWARVAGVRIFGSLDGIKAVFGTAVAAHCLEGSLAWRLARKHEPHNAAAWAMQTALLGFPSLTLLQQRYARKRAVSKS